MENLIQYYRKIELFFGSLKFAVIIIAVFAVTLAYGTFMESYHGPDYANRLIYKSIPFMALQFFMFLSILFATLIRLPPKKHLYGFYVIHAGLITIFLGSWITYQSGVDGSITLPPNSPERQIQLDTDEFRIQFPGQGKEVTLALPYTARPRNLNVEYEGIKLHRFYPFAEDKLVWVPAKIQDQAQSSSHYRLYNDNFGEFLTLTLHPMSDFNNSMQMGPLSVHYMPTGLFGCFSTPTPEGLIVWNAENNTCLAPTGKFMQRKKSVTGKEILEVDYHGQMLRFLPEMSPVPLNESLEMNQQSPFRIFSKKLFEKSPHLFLFGKSAAFFDKETSTWLSREMDLNQEVELPWMGFKVLLLDHRLDAYPTLSPEYVVPIQDNGQLISGQMRAVEVEVGGQTFWVKSTEPISFNQFGDKIRFDLSKKHIVLPYELVLDEFKMDTDPGTANPASYESFVTLFKGNDGSSKHHIFMNNPLKYQNFTFYQASYFQTQQGPFGSVLSVNFDPGRFWKYLGSLMLVLGSIWHYILRRKHIQKIRS
jgi:hypothetical protein